MVVGRHRREQQHRSFTLKGRIVGPFLVAVLLLGCAGPPRDITQLVLQDSVYVVQETMESFSGRVYKSFEDDPNVVQLSGSLAGGRWNGELTVYYLNGRIRYQGEFVDGERCGTWFENRDEDPPAGLLAQVMEEIESLAMYPPCPGS